MDGWEAVNKKLRDYIAKKHLKIGFSYKDVWHEEHAAAFTVAKAMQIDILSDIQKAVERATQGQSFETFRKNLAPTLQQKGWWGRKTMIDPETGEEVNAQLGSSRRLETIYDVNIRAAYNKERYDSIMNNDSLPYLIYRIGASAHHREEHLAWDGLILPKNDPWWSRHLPQKEYGCNCNADGITEWKRDTYLEGGVPRLKRGGGGIIPAKTEAPPEVYRTYFNERTGTLERVPQGVHPSFNWDIRTMGRNAAAAIQLARKTQAKAPKQFDEVLKSIFANSVCKKDYYGFIEKALKRKIDGSHVTAVGFIDSKVGAFLDKEKAGVGEHNIIMLASKLVTQKKFSGRHAVAGNAPADGDWYNLMDYLMDANVYFESGKNGLIYLKKLDDHRYMKIAVDIGLRGLAHRGARLILPKVDTMYILDLAEEGDRGSNEYNRILRTKKIK